MSGKLRAVLPLIESLCKEAGAPGLAVGVIHQGEVLDELNYGYRHVEAQLPVNSETAFYVASLTKGITATALGILVHRGQLQWDTPVHDILPEMSKSTELYEAKLNILDILSHRTGKAWADALYLQSNNRILLPKDRCIPTFDYLPQVAPVRNKFMYNNHAYNMAGLVIERVSGRRWDEFVTENIFEPLGMTRTFTRHPDGDENVAVPYNILTDRTPFRLPFCNASGDTMMFAGQSVRTSVGDLLKYSAAYLRALDEINPRGSTEGGPGQSGDGGSWPSILGGMADSTRNWLNTTTNTSIPDQPSRPIKEIATIARPHVPREVDSLFEQTIFLKPFPLLCERYPGKLVIWHGGNMPGTTAALCLLPESDTAVVVMQNSLGLCDVADWVCQLIIDFLFLASPAQGYLSLAKTCVEAGVKRMDDVRANPDRERTEGTKPRSQDSYTGRYYNSIRNWFMDIRIVGEDLVLEFLGRSDERYVLRHYHYDTFTWDLSYDELVKRGQYIRPYQYYRLEFESYQGGGQISRLRWRHDSSVPGRAFLQGGILKEGFTLT